MQKLAIISFLMLFSCTTKETIKMKTKNPDKAKIPVKVDHTIAGIWRLDSIMEKDAIAFRYDKAKIDEINMTGMVFNSTGDVKSLLVNSNREEQRMIGTYSISNDSLFMDLNENASISKYRFERSPKRLVLHSGAKTWFHSMYFDDSYELIHGPGSIERTN